MSLLDNIKYQFDKATTPLKDAVSKQFNSITGIVKDYFEPDPSGKVRVRDVLREVPAAKNRAVMGAANFVKEAAQGTARNIGSLGVSAVNQARKESSKLPSTLPGLPSTPERERIIAEGSQLIPEIKPDYNSDVFRRNLQKVVFGDDAIESIQTREDRAPQRATEFAQSLGFKDQNIVNKTTALPFVLGSIGLDAFTGGGKKKAAEELATHADDIARLARNSNTFDEFVSLFNKGVDGVPPEPPPPGVIAKLEETFNAARTVPKDIETSVVQYTDGDKQYFQVIPKGELERFHNLIDDTSGGIAGENRNGKVWHLTAKSPEQMAERGFIYDGIANEKKIADDAGKNIIPDENKIPFGEGGTITTTQENGFTTTIKNSPNTNPAVAQKLASNYNPINNNDTLVAAKNLINTDPNEAYRLARALDEAPTAESNAVAQLLVKKAQDAGNYEEAIDLVEITAKRATTAGQAIQALSMWNRLTPDGILGYAQRTIRNAEKAGKKIPPLTPDKARVIVDQARKIEGMVDGEEKAWETARMLGNIADLVPPSIAKKISSFQTIAQLLNPKTTIRNIVGNVAFAGIENAKDVFAAGLDSALSLGRQVIGKDALRTKTLPDLAVQSKSALAGLRQGIREAIHGVDTLGVPSQFELPNTPVFKGGVLGNAEKLLNVVLKAPDRAMYKAAYDGSLYQSMKAAGVDAPTDAMREIAHHEGLYRTFQDENRVTQIFTGLKKVLNLVGTKDFGLGDIIIKYPKTPANILARGLEYSPAGFLNAIYEASRPLMGTQKFDQRKFVEAFSRATAGSAGLVGMGSLLNRLGIITGKPDKDKDINAVAKTAGLGGYKINASAMKRFALSGFDPETAKLKPGDKLYSYDWFQPAAIGISIGANIDEASQNREKTGEKAKGVAETLIQGVADGFNTVADQPIFQGITQLMKYGDASTAVESLIKQIPSSFVPTLLNQINQFVDNTSRNVYDPSILRQAVNAAKQRVPGFSQTLQPKVDVFGKEAEIYQSAGNNLWNVFFNPSFKTIYKPTPEAKMVLDLYEQTGEVKQAPRLVKPKVTINGVERELGPKRVVEMQQFVGSVTKEVFRNLALNDNFRNLPSEEKIKALSNILTDVGTAAKMDVLGHIPTKRDRGAEEMLQLYYFTDLMNKPSLVNQNDSIGELLKQDSGNQNPKQEPAPQQ